ncbi:phage head completion protein [Qipengyuania sp. SM2507]
MRAGTLNRTVELLKRGPATDNGIEMMPGNFIVAGARLASVKPEQRAETTHALGLTGQKVLRIWLRYDSLTRTVSAKWGLRFEGQTYELAAEPIEIGRREGVELIAVASDLTVAGGT